MYNLLTQPDEGTKLFLKSRFFWVLNFWKYFQKWFTNIFKKNYKFWKSQYYLCNFHAFTLRKFCPHCGQEYTKIVCPALNAILRPNENLQCQWHLEHKVNRWTQKLSSQFTGLCGKTRSSIFGSISETEKKTFF